MPRRTRRSVDPIIDSIKQVGEEWIGWQPPQVILIDYQCAALAACVNRSQVVAVFAFGLRVGLHSEQWIVHRNGHRQMRKRKDSFRVNQIQRANFSPQLSRRNTALDRRVSIVACIGDNRETESLRRTWRQAINRDVGRLAQQRGELECTVDIKQYDLAPIVGEICIKSRQDRRRTDGKIDDRLKRYDRRQAPELGRTREPLNLRLQRVGQPERLTSAVHREGVVLERIELWHDAEPGRLRKWRQDGGQASKPGKARETRDTDHWRQQ